jgi:hypothetical protein
MMTVLALVLAMVFFVELGVEEQDACADSSKTETEHVV